MKRIPHTFTIVFSLIVFAALLTWIVPGGEFVRETVVVESADGSAQTRGVVKNDSFHRVDRNPQTWQIFSALFSGFCDKADIIVFILIVGGAFWILNNSRAIEIGVMSFLALMKRLERFALFRKMGVENLVIVFTMTLFSLFGAVFGMSEETIAFIVVFVPLSISMGYDSIVGVCMCYMAAHVGFAGAILNPFTIGIAQGIAGLPLFSGMEYRILCWVVLTTIAIVFVLLYAKRVKLNPHKSPVYEIDAYWRERVEQNDTNAVEYSSPLVSWVVYAVLAIVMVICAFKYPITSIALGNRQISVAIVPILTVLYIVTGFFTLRKSYHYFVLDILVFTVFFLVVGVLGYGWYIKEISALFLAMGILSGIASSRKADDIAKLFIAGCKDIMSAALVVGLASGIIFILRDGVVIDTILYGLTKSLSKAGDMASTAVMYTFQTFLNVVMPSGSAKAALTMPIMAQFADLANISRQTVVLAFQLGDGITNMITPTSGVLIGCLGMARIPYSTWLKWVWKFILMLIIVGFVLLLPTLYIQFPGF